MLRTTLAILLLAAPAYADEAHSNSSACPAPVTTGAMKAFPKATIRACKAEHEHGKDFFEIKLTKANGDKVELDVAPGGEILQIEETIAVDALPDAVKKAFAAKSPKTKASAAEKQTAGKVIRYEIAFQTDKGRKEATFASDGTFVEEE